jgi:AcrR family transcriptional regulator
LEVALELFSEKDFKATSTAVIAKKAGVSEGLIFRHFVNKKGLLDTLIKQCDKRMMEIMGPILFQTDARKVILMAVALLFIIDKSDYPYMKLQLRLKWNTGYYSPNKMLPYYNKLKIAFMALEYNEPELEAMALNQLNETVSLSLMRGEITEEKAYLDFLLNKYRKKYS